jgi:hypothetical protein
LKAIGELRPHEHPQSFGGVWVPGYVRVVCCLFFIQILTLAAHAQTATYHLHKEASTINSSFDKLLTASPDAASAALTTVLTGKLTGNYLIKEFETQTSVPNTAA